MNSRLTRQPSLDAAQVEAFRQEKNRRRISDQEIYFNSQFEPQQPVYLDPGQALWTEDQNQVIVGMAGSGVLVSIHDSELHMGAMGYVLMPAAVLDCFPHFENADKALLRMAFAPLDECVGQMKRHGAAKNRIRIRLMGGATLPGDAQDTGTKNYVFVREYIERKKLMVLNEDLGGASIRRVHYFPTTGRCVRSVLRRNSDFAFIRDLEFEYQNRISTKN